MTLSPTEEARARVVDQALNLLDLVLGQFDRSGHPGRECLRTDWMAVETVTAWRTRAAELRAALAVAGITEAVRAGSRDTTEPRPEGAAVSSSPTVPLDDGTLELILAAIADEAGLNDDLSRDPGQFSLPRLLEFLADDADTEGLEPVAHGHWRGELTPIYDRALPADRQSLDVYDVVRALIAEVRRLRGVCSE